MVLAIVLTISVPGVLGIIQSAKKNAFKQSASMLLETGSVYYGQRKMDHNSIKDQEVFYFPETTELEYSGEKPKDGYLTIYEDGSQYIEITNGTYCAYGDQASDIKIKDGQCQDQTPGILDGSGTEKDPYKIESIEDLVQFGKNVDNGDTYENQYITLERSLDFKNEKSYVNSNRTDYGDINENGVSESLLTELTTEKGFNPIGSYVSASDNSPFHGIFDGNAYSFSNFYFSRLEERSLGLFSRNLGVIQNFKIHGNAFGSSYVGLVAGTNRGEIFKVKGTGNIGGSLTSVGGIAGQNGNTEFASIVDCEFSGTVVGKEGYAGGISGSSFGRITNCVAEGDVMGSQNLGGITGSQQQRVLKNSYSNVEVKFVLEDDSAGVSGHCGGLAGITGATNVDHSNVKVENVYTIGDVNCQTETGGLIGQNGASSENTKTKYLTVEKGYSLGNVIGEQDAIGGSIGTNVMNVRNIYAGGDVFGRTEVGNVVGRRENSEATITNVYSKEGQQISGSNLLTLGSTVSLSTLSPSSWWKTTLGFDNNWKIEDGYYPLLYKVDESGNPTTELLPGQKNIPILST